MEFEKWQGLGNDFLIVREEVSPERAIELCDRRLGVGGDGVLVWLNDRDADARMIVLNADGSRPEMCGNGLRCVVGAVADARGIALGELRVATDAGVKRCTIEGRDGAHQVDVAMGEARVGDGETFGGRRFEHVDVGNPHAVSFDAFVDADLDAVGPALEKATAGGVNVELCRVDEGGRRIDVIVWERGVGRTQACGTGACAVAAAAVATKRSQADVPIEVVLPGGSLWITVHSADGSVTMRGPARRVFRGIV